MKETLWITLDGKRVGTVTDRKKQIVQINAKPSQYHGIQNVEIDGKPFQVEYLQKDVEERTSDCWCGGGGCPDCPCCW